MSLMAAQESSYRAANWIGQLEHFLGRGGGGGTVVHLGDLHLLSCQAAIVAASHGRPPSLAMSVLHQQATAHYYPLYQLTNQAATAHSTKISFFFFKEFFKTKYLQQRLLCLCDYRDCNASYCSVL